MTIESFPPEMAISRESGGGGNRTRVTCQTDSLLSSDNDVLQRFTRKHVLDTETGCWVWQRGLDPNGYGNFFLNGRQTKAHRAGYMLHVGPIPDGLVIDHLCRNPSCVNPAHLEPVTMRENNRRGTGYSGRKAQQTHCVRGHEFTPENTHLTKAEERRCKACNRLHQYARNHGISVVEAQRIREG